MSAVITLPKVNEVYDLGREFDKVVIAQVDNNHIRFKWFLNGQPMNTIMGVNKFWEMNPIKTGTL